MIPAKLPARSPTCKMLSRSPAISRLPSAFSAAVSTLPSTAHHLVQLNLRRNTFGDSGGRHLQCRPQPPRIASRNLFDAGVGTDNLFHKEKLKTDLKLSALNLTNNDALYNFLSPSAAPTS